MALYCTWVPDGTFEGHLDCVEVPDEVEVPPETPPDGESDPTGEIVLPDGSTVDATGVLPTLVGAKQIAWQQTPWQVLWILRTDGVLVGFTYSKERNTWGAHRQPRSNGAVMSIEVIPNPITNQEELWKVVRRMIGPADAQVQKQYIERMTPRFEAASPDDKASYCHLDSAALYNGAASNTFTGAAHLAGMTCRAWADGVDYPEIEVDGSGGFSLPDGVKASVVKLGIHTAATLISLPVAGLATERQTIAEMIVMFVRTLYAKVGRTPATLEVMQFRDSADVMGTSPPLWGGQFQATLGGGWDDQGIYVIQQDTAGPMTIAAVFPQYVK